MKKTITLTVPVINTGRVHQLAGFFELQPTQASVTTYEVNLPIEERDWHIGLVVGPSGSGKSTIAREFFDEWIVRPFRWPHDKSIVDAFPADLGIKEITELLGSVGFSSPPSWLRPFRALSNGEQFRVTIAHALAQKSELTVVDEFTSVVDRQVAQICSAAVARTVRKRNQRLIAVSCHYDIIDWLQPDWVYDAGVRSFQWRELQRRPNITLTVRRVDKTAWRVFKHHHYLSADLSMGAYCFVALLGDRPVAFTAVLPFPHATRPGWREHRTVCLPDFQGVGIGNAMSAYIASLFRATGKPYFSVTGNPSMIYSRNRSQLWRLTRQSGFTAKQGKTSSIAVNRHGAQQRLTAGFEYVGPTNSHDAVRFGVPVAGGKA